MLRQEVLEHIANQASEQLAGERRQGFLLALKYDEQKSLRIIEENLMIAIREAARGTRQTIALGDRNHQKEVAKEILGYFKTHFAREISALKPRCSCLE